MHFHMTYGWWVLVGVMLYTAGGLGILAVMAFLASESPNPRMTLVGYCAEHNPEGLILILVVWPLVVLAGLLSWLVRFIAQMDE